MQDHTYLRNTAVVSIDDLMTQNMVLEACSYHCSWYPTCLYKMLGRWVSEAYKVYVKYAAKKLPKISKHIVVAVQGTETYQLEKTDSWRALMLVLAYSKYAHLHVWL